MGRWQSIEEAIREMAIHQRGAKLTDADVKSIEAWFDSLTGDLPAEYGWRQEASGFGRNGEYGNACPAPSGQQRPLAR
jgi:hypothetical protein